jgi:branched-chain amino acid transport system permease protein
VTKISGFSGIGGINRYTPGWIGDVLAHPNRLYYIAMGVAIFTYVLIRYLVRTPFGLTLQGVRDEPIRMASLGYVVPLHRTLAFGFGAFLAAIAGILYAWFAGQVAPGDVDLPQTCGSRARGSGPSSSSSCRTRSRRPRMCRCSASAAPSSAAASTR